MSSFPWLPTLLSERAQPIMFTPDMQLIWTEREDQRLMNSYKKIPREKLLMLFPDRTWLAIVSRAYLLKIPRKGRWYTPEEDAKLLELYYQTDLTYEQMSQHFPFRNLYSLRNRIYAIRKQRKEAEGIHD